MSPSPFPGEPDPVLRERLEANRIRYLESLRTLHASLRASMAALPLVLGERINQPFRPISLHVTIPNLMRREVSHEMIELACDVLFWADDNCMKDVRLDWTVDDLGRFVAVFLCDDREDAEMIADHWNGEVWN